MQHQKAIYLQEMGITRWQLRKPQLFPQYQPLFDISHAPLLVICSESDTKHPLMNKILNAFAVDQTQVEYLTMQAFEDHQGTLPNIIWSTVGNISELNGHQILTSPNLDMLSNNHQEKKSLWKQFCDLKK